MCSREVVVVVTIMMMRECRRRRRRRRRSAIHPIRMMTYPTSPSVSHGPYKYLCLQKES